MIEFRNITYRIGDLVEYSVIRHGKEKWKRAVVVYDRERRRYGLQIISFKTKCIAKFRSGIVNIRKIQRIKLKKYKGMEMKDYDIDKFKHYTYKVSSGMPCIGCCCQCIHHKEVGGHPWHNGKSILTVSAYVCTYTAEEGDMFMLSSRHGIGCECFEGNADWELHLNKLELLGKLKK